MAFPAALLQPIITVVSKYEAGVCVLQTHV